jgi:arginine decarboxylase-like protein
LKVSLCKKRTALPAYGGTEIAKMKSAIAEIAQTYGIENWGAGYFSVNSKGHLVVHPSENAKHGVDVKLLID